MAFKIVVKECDAAACGYQCLQVCPLGVFFAVPPGGTHRAAGHTVVAHFAGDCNGCGLCVQVCPRDAISLQR